MDPVNRTHTPSNYIDTIHGKIARLPIEPSLRKPKADMYKDAALGFTIASAFFCILGVKGLTSESPSWRAPVTNLIFGEVDSLMLTLVSAIVVIVAVSIFLAVDTTLKANPINENRKRDLANLRRLFEMESHLPPLGYHVTNREQADEVFVQFSKVKDELQDLYYSLQTFGHHFLKDLQILAFSKQRVEAANTLVKSYYEWHKSAVDATAKAQRVNWSTRGYAVEIASEAVDAARV